VSAKRSRFSRGALDSQRRRLQRLVSWRSSPSEASQSRRPRALGIDCRHAVQWPL